MEYDQGITPFYRAWKSLGGGEKEKDQFLKYLHIEQENSPRKRPHRLFGMQVRYTPKVR